MAQTTFTTTLEELADLIGRKGRGIFSLVGDHGGLSLITGEIYSSNVIIGTTAIETEHGTIYLDGEIELTVSEDDCRPG